MLSPDPVTQAPENGQNYNRYTYAYNNPLKYSDPSGFCFSGAGADTTACSKIAKFVIASAAGYVFDGIFGGNGCDKTCKLRKAAITWCRTNAICYEYAQTVKEKWRKRALVPIFLAEMAGDNWSIQNGQPVVENHIANGITRDVQILMADVWFFRIWDAAQRQNRAIIVSRENQNLPVGTVIRGGRDLEQYRLTYSTVGIPNNLEYVSFPGLKNNGLPLPSNIQDATAIVIMTPVYWTDVSGYGYDWNDLAIKTEAPVFVTLYKTNEVYVFTGQGDPALWEPGGL